MRTEKHLFAQVAEMIEMTFYLEHIIRNLIISTKLLDEHPPQIFNLTS
ncbi:hypothetical protein [Peribacillus simplex]|nr:hypothetical protein [Peribacillus simplex]